MRLYTRRGDDGQTGLFAPGRVGKDDPRVEAYGTVDELNAAIGLAATVGPLLEDLQTLQGWLFELGADLCTPLEAETRAQIRAMDHDRVDRLEGMIDAQWAPLPPLQTFILPGGTELAARLHLARTIARRAERRTVALARVEGINPVVITFLNRVGDLLFAMARRANQAAGVDDVSWSP